MNSLSGTFQEQIAGTLAVMGMLVLLLGLLRGLLFRRVSSREQPINEAELRRTLKHLVIIFTTGGFLFGLSYIVLVYVGESVTLLERFFYLSLILFGTTLLVGLGAPIAFLYGLWLENTQDGPALLAVVRDILQSAGKRFHRRRNHDRS